MLLILIAGLKMKLVLSRLFLFSSLVLTTSCRNEKAESHVADDAQVAAAGTYRFTDGSAGFMQCYGETGIAVDSEIKIVQLDSGKYSLDGWAVGHVEADDQNPYEQSQLYYVPTGCEIDGATVGTYYSCTDSNSSLTVTFTDANTIKIAFERFIGQSCHLSEENIVIDTETP